MTDKYITQVAYKMDIIEDKVIRKANELYKLLGSHKSLTCSESCKAVVCLELANTLVGTEIIKREKSTKVSGCKKSNYLNMFNIISKILNLDKIVSMRELCLNLGMVELENTATTLFEKYKAANCLSQQELQHPMFPCATVLATCWLNKIKVKIEKIVEISRLKKSELEELAKKIQMFGEQPEGRRKRSAVPTRDIAVIAKDSPTPKKVMKKTEKEFEAEYQEWKKRMLAE